MRVFINCYKYIYKLAVILAKLVPWLRLFTTTIKNYLITLNSSIYQNYSFDKLRNFKQFL